MAHPLSRIPRTAAPRRRTPDLVRVTRNAYGHSIPEGSLVRLRGPALTVPGGVVVEAPHDPRGWELLWPGEWAPWRPETLAPPRPAQRDTPSLDTPGFDTAGGGA